MKNPYGLVERVRSPGENLTEIIDKFGASNRQLGANKSPKESERSSEWKYLRMFSPGGRSSSGSVCLQL